MTTWALLAIPIVQSLPTPTGPLVCCQWDNEPENSKSNPAARFVRIPDGKRSIPDPPLQPYSDSVFQSTSNGYNRAAPAILQADVESARTEQEVIIATGTDFDCYYYPNQHGPTILNPRDGCPDCLTSGLDKRSVPSENSMVNVVKERDPMCPECDFGSLDKGKPEAEPQAIPRRVATTFHSIIKPIFKRSPVVDHHVVQRDLEPQAPDGM